jgi:ubiquinone/menaquinone biosynthesis C-methylase UbiE/GNAT superfamily N-acetyltransferase
MATQTLFSPGFAAQLPGGSQSPIQSPVPNPYAPKADFSAEEVEVVETPKADFDLAGLEVVDTASKADFDPAGVEVVEPQGPTVYTPEQIKAMPDAELLKLKDFSPELFGAQNAEALRADPELLNKVLLAYRQRATEGTTLGEKVKSVFTGIPMVAKALGSGIKAAVTTAAKLNPAVLDVRSKIASATGKEQEFLKDTAKTALEVPASVEAAATGSTDLLRRSAREIGEGVGKIVPESIRPLVALTGAPVSTPKSELSDEQWTKRFFDDVAHAKNSEDAALGNGAVMDALGADAATLKEKHGIELDTDQIQALSVVTDPINYVPIGAAVGFTSKIGGRVVRGAIAQTLNPAQAAKLAKTLNTATEAAGAAKRVAGKTVSAVGGAIESVGNVAEKSVRSVGGTAGGLGLGAILGRDVYSALGGAALAKGAPRVVQAIGRTVEGAGDILQGARPAPLLAQAAGRAATGGAKGVAEGATLVLPFEIGARPDEEEFLLGAAGLGGAIRGTVEGGAPLAKAAGQSAQNALAQTVFEKVNQLDRESPAYGDFPELDSVHEAELAKRPAPEQALVRSVREVFRQSPEAEMQAYVIPENEFVARTGQNALGYAFTVGERVAPDGTAKPVVQLLMKSSADSLPHELFHALESLDPEGASALKADIEKNVTPEQREAFEQVYNSRINGGKPESAWTYRLPKDKVIAEIAAEAFSRILLSQDLRGVTPSVTQKAALFTSRVLEALGSPLGGVGLSRREAGVSNLNVRPGAATTSLGRKWLGDLIGRLNESGTLDKPVGRIEAVDPDRSYKPKPVQTPPPLPDVDAAYKPKPVVEPPALPKAEEIQPVAAPQPPKVEAVNPPSPEVPPVEPEIPNIRVKRASQDDFVGSRAEVTNVDAAKAAAEKTGDDRVVSLVNEISPVVEKGAVIEIIHSGAESGEFRSGRTARRLEQEAAYIAEGLANAPESIRKAYQKVFVPVRWEVVAGKPQLLAMSLDKVIANAHRTVKDVAKAGVEAKIPYEIVDGKLTDNAWGQFVDDLQAYSENQANGYRGDGQKLTRPTEDVGLSIPAENPNYTPRSLTEERMNFLNLVQGLNPPLTARVGKQSSKVVPGNVKGQILAEVNRRTPETPSVIRPKDIAKQKFPGGRSIKETNPLRNELAAAGVPVRELIEVTERINAPDIQSWKARPELDFAAPVTDTIRGGFLPEDLSSFADEVLAWDAAKFNAEVRSWEGGQRRRAYEIGLNAKTPEEVAKLKQANEQASADRKRFMAAKDIDNGVASALKAQFFREAYEAATDTGSAAGENGWRQVFPDRTAPFPEGSFLPDEQKTGLAFKDFFSSVTKGEFGKSNVTFEPVLDVDAQAPFIAELAKHSGNFDEHISKSIPTFKETQVRKGDAIVKSYPDGARVLDIGASEGSLMKTVSALSDGKIETVSLDPNPDMAKFFREKSEVPGASYVEEAFLNGFKDGDKEVPAYKPTEKFDVVHEAMVFQFISPEREAQIAEAKRLMKPEGVLLIEEKVKNPAWAANEAKKDRSYKDKYFSKAELAEKDKRVGFQQAKQETKAVGMVDNMVEQTTLEELLSKNFSDVVQYWDSGNFKGYAASDSRAALDTLVGNMGDLNSEFSTVKTPAPAGQFLPETAAGKKLVEDGYILLFGGYDSNRKITLIDDGKNVGSISSYRTSPKVAEIGLVEIDPDHRGGGVGEALYRELLTQLKKDGVTEVSGRMISGGPLRIRQKLFGKVDDLRASFEPVDIDTAMKNFATVERRRDAGEVTAGYSVVGRNTITPDMQFLPSDSPRAVKMAAFLDDSSGEIYLGEAHYLALGKALEAGADEARLIDGFVTNEGEFLTRDVAMERALELKQVTEDAYKSAIQSYEDEGGSVGSLSPKKLESFTFDDVRAFLPDDVKRKSKTVGPDWEYPPEQDINKIDFSKYVTKKSAPKTSAKTVKTAAWVTPDGKVENLSAAWHEQELANRADEWNKKFGTKLSKKVDPAERLEALNSGFVRVRYTPNNGQMNIEVGAKHWTPAMKTRVQDVLKANADKIDSLSMNLVAPGGELVDSAFENVVKAKNKESALNDIVSSVKAGEVKAGKGPTAIQRARAMGQFAPDEAPLLDLGLPDESAIAQTRIKNRVSSAKEKFPEAILPLYAKDEFGFVMKEDGKPKPVTIEYNLMDTPVAKLAAKGIRGDEARQEAVAKAIGEKLVTAAKAAAKDKKIAAGVTWYSTARTRLRKLLGDDSKFFAELLGATSARTPVDINFRFALDAYNQFKAGKFDGILKKYREGKDNWEKGKIQDFLTETGKTLDDTTRGQYLDWWITKHDLSPVQSNGRKFGANSRPVLRVLDGSWADEVQGPKTPNFAGNLTGETFEATVDVWAARLLHRMANEGNEKRWRILPENETGVTDADFFLGQAAYRYAAEKLGMKPDALQAILWFYEKDHWEKKGWTRGAGAEKSDFNSLFAETERKPSGQLEIRKAQQSLDLGLGLDDIKPVNKGQFSPRHVLKNDAGEYYTVYGWEPSTTKFLSSAVVFPNKLIARPEGSWKKTKVIWDGSSAKLPKDAKELEER